MAITPENQLPPNNPPPEPPPERRRGSPLPWLLLLIAIALVAWWAYSRHANEAATGSDMTTTTEPAPMSGAANAPGETASTAAKPAAKKPARPKPVDREATVVSKVIPKYPAAALRGGDAGMVIVRVQVDSAGAPGSASIVKRSGSRDLDRAALDAIRKWRFSPAMHDGKPVAATLDVPVQFTQAEQ